MPVIDTRLFKILMTRTPEGVTPAITALCRDVSPGHEPGFVDVAPDPGAEPGECFPNVRAKVARDGGEILYGWAIWEWPRVFVEAEHHAVWLSEGRMLDITPHVPPTGRILFLPDPGRADDAATRHRLRNRKRSVGELPMVPDWIEATDELFDYMGVNAPGWAAGTDPDRARSLYDRTAQLRGSIYVALAASTKRNDRCFCGSGRKFKVCCSRLVDLNA